MNIYESLDFSEKFHYPVLTIGNYDGVHIGHRKIIEEVIRKARAAGGTSMLMTFNPHPLNVVKPETPVGLISPVDVKKRLVEESGIDVLVIVPFTAEFRTIEPEDYVKTILVERLGIKSLIVGYDFRFGKGGRGDVALMARLADELGFEFEVMQAITLGGEKIGSNRIRRMIREGEVERAMGFLGRPYTIEGEVVKGFGRGHEIGFPTINISTSFELIPRIGVYSTEMRIGGERFHSVTNIGYNPTFDGKELTIETFILDFSGDLYGREVALAFHKRIRDEMKFPSVDALKARIAADVETTAQYFREKEEG